MKKFCTRILALLFVFAAPAFAQSKVEPPVPVRTVQPTYPNDLRREGVMGVVVIKCVIDQQGNVTEPEVEKSSNAGFDRAALDAVKRWKFKPAKQDGNPIAQKVSIPIKFVSDEG
ncbi:energy transducer TonB [Opitutus sp. ER46]|uniref:energy transducer TonB n=1 Tax=Opitutus sp. ER46 TaxID=2161864 RepID=UPI000D320B2A|nr:energy transducer TonB [Opitutus sp. ER46]PTX94362.1 hypothetical protein DB354_11445 [Opitutus sp. ER46]